MSSRERTATFLSRPLSAGCFSARAAIFALRSVGSFKEATDTIALLGCGTVSESKISDEALHVGKDCLDAQRNPGKDVRSYTEAQQRIPENGRHVLRTLVAMADGTNAPCTKADTKGIPGKNGGEAGSRQLRVMSFNEYVAVTEKIGNAQKEYRTCRAIMLRHGAGSAVDRIKRLYAKELAASEEARSALDYLDRRRENMRYGWLRKHGYYISSAHAEAAARILVARRCKQAGMHGRHENAARICALIAKH